LAYANAAAKPSELLLINKKFSGRKYFHFFLNEHICFALCQRMILFRLQKFRGEEADPPSRLMAKLQTRLRETKDKKREYS